MAGSRTNSQHSDGSRWGEVLGDDVVTAAMIDRLVHHAEILSPNGPQA
jgi:DNA replication protein DnaC